MGGYVLFENMSYRRTCLQADIFAGKCVLLEDI